MKKYEKPVLTAITLSGNDQLCGSCADKKGYVLVEDQTLAKVLMEFYQFGDLNDGVGADDFIGIFGNAEKDCSKIQIENYCKFNAVDNGNHHIAWS